MFTTSESMIHAVNSDSPVETEAFLEAYYPYFKILLAHNACPPQDIDDLCTPIALKLLKALKTFDRQRPGSLRKLIKLIVQRTLANYFAKMKTQSQMIFKESRELIPELDEVVLHEEQLSSDDYQVLYRVCRLTIDDYLRRVEPLTYKALKLYVMEYRDGREVAEKLDISANSVYNHKRNFFLNIVQQAQAHYESETKDSISKSFIAEALYNYLLDNNPSLTMQDATLPDQVLRKVSFLRDKLEGQVRGRALIFFDGNEERLNLEKSISIGSRNADFIIDNTRLSGPHCELLLEGEIVTLKDLESSNGSYINGEKVNEQILLHGDLVQLGSEISFVFQANDEM